MRVDIIDRARERWGLPPWGPPQWAAIFATFVLGTLLGYVAYTRFTTPAPVAVNVAPVTQGPIAASVSGAGTVVADSASNVSFRSSGRVAADHVQAGQPLAQLDTQDLRASLQQAQGTEANAAAQLQKIQAGARPEDVAAAEATLAQQQAQLQNLTTANPPDVAAAQAALAGAQATLAGLVQGRPEDVQQAQAALANASAALQNLEAQGRPESVAAAQAALDSAQAKLQETAMG